MKITLQTSLTLAILFMATSSFSAAQEIIRDNSLQFFHQPVPGFSYACKYEGGQKSPVGKLSSVDLKSGSTWSKVNSPKFVKKLRKKIKRTRAKHSKIVYKQRLLNFRTVVAECKKFNPEVYPAPNPTLSPTPTIVPTTIGTLTPNPIPIPTINPTISQFETSDWDLLMMRLVNRARVDPSGEAARIGTSVTDARAAVAPLAYDALVAKAARNHNNWMHDNFGSIPSGRAPDSFSHYETLDGLSAGTPAIGTVNYSGARTGDRLTFAGYLFSNWGENILTSYASFALSVAEADIYGFHKRWWESSGHRNNMLSSGYGTFGFAAESRAFIAPRGGLNAPVDNILFGTQVFSMPLNQPRSQIFGLLFKDRDLNGSWTPRASSDSLREGIANANVDVFIANTSVPVVSGSTFENGAFSLQAGNGTYDILFTSSAIQGGSVMLGGVSVSGINSDAGDVKVN